MLIDHSIKELSNLLKKKEISSVDLVKESYSRIEEFDLKLHSFITIKDKTIALKEAEEKDKNIKNNSSIVYGLPFAVKDAYVTKDLRTTAGSKILNDYYSPYNATVVEKIAKAGAILIGKNNMDNWGHGASNENTNYQIPHNPWDMERITGGSSGGSAVAVSTRMVPFAIGEDTGGSIRNPSSMCDISGLKVTYGRVSRYGAIAYASSLDTVGPMAKSVEDLSYLLEIMAGYDDHDSTSSTQKVENYQDIKIGSDGIVLKKIGSDGQIIASSVFLPQVPPSLGWDLQTTLEQLSQKAGLGKHGWKENCEFEVFQGFEIKEN